MVLRSNFLLHLRIRTHQLQSLKGCRIWNNFVSCYGYSFKQLDGLFDRQNDVGRSFRMKNIVLKIILISICALLGNGLIFLVRRLFNIQDGFLYSILESIPWILIFFAWEIADRVEY